MLKFCLITYIKSKMIVYEVPKKSGAQGSFTGLMKYLTNTQGNLARVGDIAMSNLVSDDVRMACIEATAIQKMNTRAKSDKTLHLVMSFPSGEKPSSEILKKCEEQVVKELGMNDYQRISVVHGDTDNLHVHIVINKIHPKTHNIYEPYQSYKKLAKASVECEERFGLTRDNHEFVRANVENRIEKIEIHKGEEALCSAIRTLGSRLSKAESWKEFHEILSANKYGVKIRANGLVFFDYQGNHVKASTVDRNFSKKKLEGKLGEFVPLENIKNAQDKTDQNEQTEKADEIHADTVNQNEPENNHQENQKKTSRKAAKKLHGLAEESLWKEYQELRTDSAGYTQKTRREIYDDLYEKNKRNFNRFRLQYKIYRALKIPKFMRSYLNMYLSMKVKQMKEEAYEQAKVKYQKAINTKQSWLAFLRDKAEKGNLDALNILIKRNQKNQKAGEKKTAEAGNPEKDFSMLKRLIEKNVKLAKVTSNGNKIYVFKNKVIVVTDNKIYVNNAKHSGNFRFKKSRNNRTFARSKFDKAKNKYGFKYKNFYKDGEKAEKIYESAKEESRKKSSEQYKRQADYARMKNRTAMQEKMRTYTNSQNQTRNTQKKGRTI